MSAVETESIGEAIPEEEQPIEAQTDEEEEIETIQLDASLVEKMMAYIDVLVALRDGKISITEAQALIKSIYPDFGAKKSSKKSKSKSKSKKKSAKTSSKSKKKKVSSKPKKGQSSE